MDRDTGRKADSDERNHRNQDRRKGFAVMEVTETNKQPAGELVKFIDRNQEWLKQVIDLGYVGLREQAFVTGCAGCGRRTDYTSIRQLSTMLQPSVFASPDTWPSSEPMSPAAIGEHVGK